MITLTTLLLLLVSSFSSAHMPIKPENNHFFKEYTEENTLYIYDVLSDFSPNSISQGIVDKKKNITKIEILYSNKKNLNKINLLRNDFIKHGLENKKVIIIDRKKEIKNADNLIEIKYYYLKQKDNKCYYNHNNYRSDFNYNLGCALHNNMLYSSNNYNGTLYKW
ncbi:hypothetical protein ACE5I6_14515 [Yersinia ruckeri]|uniref:hypothetical protein n=1 Tax=Yersinia ruckeri TaxID=29486 RepID=UPI0008FEA192|nr:hypothetical protein [Yersinia ruckeri]OJB77565.1 hypothetical protein A9Q62_02755 [Yersinia ruckeri]OJB90233.1 hypothetical protein A9Q60_02800 [Yersinia ruckeri]